MFDLRFMCHHWDISPLKIVCTKISSKILEKNIHKHSLIDLLAKHLDVKIEKDQAKSNWLSETLTLKQKDYAANDVYYLINLFNTIKNKLISKNLWHLARNCFKHIPTRVALELHNYDDVFTY